jgi:regulatory protein
MAQTSLHDQALRLLSVRARSVRELSQRMRSKGHEPQAVAAEIERLIELRFLHDGDFAHERARAMLRSKGWGPRKLRADLARRGVATDLIDAAIAAAYQEFDPASILRREALKRFGEWILAEDVDPKLKNKAYRFLLGRGFEPEAIRELLGGEY